MTRFHALLLPLLLLLAACDPGPAQNCDYCHALRNGVQRYLCDKCTKPHAACDSEKSILHYSEGSTIRGRTYYSATSILTCPAPADQTSSPEPKPEVTPVTVTPAPPASTFLPKLTFWQQAVAFLLFLVVFFVGYSRGRIDRGLGTKLGNKKEASK